MCVYVYLYIVCVCQCFSTWTHSSESEDHFAYRSRLLQNSNSFTIPLHIPFQGSSKATVIGIIEKHRSAAPSKPKGTPAPAAEPKKPPKAEKAPEKSTEKATKKTASGKPRGKAGSKASAGQKVSSSKKNAPEPSTGSPLVFVPNGKESRTKDEERMKTLKWNFQAPRTEHIDQLKEQLAPCVSTDLHASLFHDDFKKHLAALATLTKVFYDCTL